MQFAFEQGVELQRNNCASSILNSLMNEYIFSRT